MIVLVFIVLGDMWFIYDLDDLDVDSFLINGFFVNNEIIFLKIWYIFLKLIFW